MCNILVRAFLLLILKIPLSLRTVAVSLVSLDDISLCPLETSTLSSPSSSRPFSHQYYHTQYRLLCRQHHKGLRRTGCLHNLQTTTKPHPLINIVTLLASLLPHHNLIRLSLLLRRHRHRRHFRVVELSFVTWHGVHPCTKGQTHTHTIIFNYNIIVEFIIKCLLTYGTSDESLAGPMSERVVNPVAL